MTNEQLALEIAKGLVATGVEGGYNALSCSTAGDYPSMGCSQWEGINGRGDNLLGYIDGGAGGSMSYMFSKNVTDIILSGETPAGAGGGGGGGYADTYDGGAGGNGGGSLEVVAKSIILSGTITAKGANGTNARVAGGGGGGGMVVFVADTISNTGTIIVTGGIGGTSDYGSGAAGSNGIVYLKALGAV